MRPKKHLSQYFLTNKSVLQRIADSIVTDKNACILEIGSGRGELTCFITDKARQVICVEIDEKLCGVLSERFKDLKNVKICCQDIENFDMPSEDIVAVGNVPYHISFKILDLLIKNRKKVRHAYLTLQKEFAQKLTGLSGSKSYGFLTCFINLYCDVKILFNIRKSCFYPNPKVDSSLVEFNIYLKPKWDITDENFFKDMVRKIFSQRRKKIINILKQNYPDADLKTILSRCAISADQRPENISTLQFVNLANAIVG